MQITVFSRRYYENELPDFSVIRDWCADMCRIKYRLYDAWYDHNYPRQDKADILACYDKSPLYHYARKLGLNALHANSLVPQVTGILKSQISLQALHAEESRSRIDGMKKKVSASEKELDRLLKVKESFRNYGRTGKWKTPYAKCTIRVENGTVSGFNIKEQSCAAYEAGLDRRIKGLRARIALIGERRKREETKLANLTTLPPKKAVFGGETLYRKKDTVCTTDEQKAAWKQEFRHAREHRITISGRKDSPCGNHSVQCCLAKNGTYFLDIRTQKGTSLYIPDFKIMRFEKEFLDIMRSGNARKIPVAYTFDFRKDKRGREFLLVTASFDLPANEQKNTFYGNGCIAVDINADRFAWSDIDGNGGMVDHGVIPFKVTGLRSGQVSDVLGRAVRLLTEVCLTRKKPLVMEDLDAEHMRLGMLYQNRKRNRIISTFACQKMLSLIESQGERYGYQIDKVNPAYTSFIGKVVYMRRFGISVHEAASYVIGLKYMEMIPDVPDELAALVTKDTKSAKDTRGTKGTKDVKDAKDTKDAPAAAASATPATDSEQYIRIGRWRSVFGKLKTVRTHAWYMKIPVFTSKQQALSWFSENDFIYPEDRKRVAEQRARIQEAIPIQGTA